MSQESVPPSTLDQSALWDLVENVSDLVQSVRPDGSFLYVNRAWREALGYTVDEIRHLSVFDVIAPASQPHCRETFVRALAGEAFTNVPTTFVTRSGEPLQFEASVNCRLIDGRPVATRTILRSVGERDRTAEALRTSEERFRSVVEMSSDAVFLANAEGMIHYASPSVTRILGYEPEELRGWSGLSLVHADDLAAAQAILQDSVDRPGEHLTFQTRARTKNGAYRWVDGVCSNHLQNPAVRALVVNYRDVTASRQAEEALRANEALRSAMLDSALDGIICIDHESRILEFNRAAETIFGYARQDVIGRDLADIIIPPAWRDRHHEGMARYFARGEAQAFGRRIELTAMRADGSEFPAELALSRIPGTTPQFVGYLRDISDRVAAEQERRRLAEQMQHAQRAESLGVLAGGIAHDFNNLLTVILGYAGLAAARPDVGTDGRRMLHEIEAAAERAADLTGQMLAYSGHSSFAFGPVNVEAVAREMSELVRVAISKDARVTLELTPASAIGDATQIRQVILNLMTNAADALDGGAGTITVRTGVRDADPAELRNPYLSGDLPAGLYAWIQVADTGSGMTPETLARLFDPFFTTRFMGRGLGLSAVLGIVRSHHGAIKVASVPAHGTVVDVYLPWAPESQPAHTTDTPPVTTPRRSGLVLVVDDEPTVQQFVRRTLEGAGFDVQVAEDGVAGLKAFTTHQREIVAIVLDATMPGLDGAGMLAEVRRLAPVLPVLVISGYAEQDIAGRFAGAGVHVFLHKPFRPQRLIDEMCRLVPPPPDA